MVISPASLLGLFGVVTSGAVLPFVPTGAAVSAAAALTGTGHPWLVAAVIAAGAAGAYVSDLLTYAAIMFAARLAERSPRISRWLLGKHQHQALDKVRGQLGRHELRTLLLSRLVPGGQLPVLLAAALGDYSWRRYALADLGAAALWSLVYAGTGLAGRAVFPKPWEGVAAGIALILAASLLVSLWSRRHPAETQPDISPSMTG